MSLKESSEDRVSVDMRDTRLSAQSSGAYSDRKASISPQKLRVMRVQYAKRHSIEMGPEDDYYDDDLLEEASWTIQTLPTDRQDPGSPTAPKNRSKVIQSVDDKTLENSLHISTEDVAQHLSQIRSSRYFWKQTARPIIANMSPSEGRHCGGTRVDLTVRNLKPDGHTKVFFGDRPATEVHVYDGHVQCVSPAAAHHGRVTVSIKNRGSWSNASEHSVYTYIGPNILRVTPRQGLLQGGTRIRITGEFLGRKQDSVKVFAGDGQCTEVNVCATTGKKLTCVTPAGLRGRVNIVVEVDKRDGAGPTRSPPTDACRFSYVIRLPDGLIPNERQVDVRYMKIFDHTPPLLDLKDLFKTAENALLLESVLSRNFSKLRRIYWAYSMCPQECKRDMAHQCLDLHSYYRFVDDCRIFGGNAVGPVCDYYMRDSIFKRVNEKAANDADPDAEPEAAKSEEENDPDDTLTLQEFLSAVVRIATVKYGHSTEGMDNQVEALLVNHLWRFAEMIPDQSEVYEAMVSPELSEVLKRYRDDIRRIFIGYQDADGFKGPKNRTEEDIASMDHNEQGLGRGYLKWTDINQFCVYVHLKTDPLLIGVVKYTPVFKDPAPIVQQFILSLIGTWTSRKCKCSKGACICRETEHVYLVESSLRERFPIITKDNNTDVIGFSDFEEFLFRLAVLVVSGSQVEPHEAVTQWGVSKCGEALQKFLDKYVYRGLNDGWESDSEREYDLALKLAEERLEAKRRENEKAQWEAYQKYVQSKKASAQAAAEADDSS